MLLQRLFMLNYLIGLSTTLISPLGRTWSRGHRLGSWTSMVLSVLNITALSSCALTLLTKSFNNILISMFSRWSRRNTKQKKLIGATLNLLITKIYWILLKRNQLA
uniref:Uncharacterized protein n=1 Tax=Arundo donax TaxID=35708 RepID=A0A0A9GGB8_ARUDO